MRDHGWENVVAGAAADLRYAARRLRKDTAFASVAVLTLALGIGAATAIFSTVNPVLFERLPYPDPERLMTVAEIGSTTPRIDVTYGTFRELVQRSHSFASLAVLKTWQPALGGLDRPERLDAQRVSAGYFRTLGVTPVLGRDFTAADDRPNGPNVVVLGHGLWQRLGGQAGIVGSTVRLDDTPYTVIGVMPARFENLLAPSAQVWAPLQYGESFAPDSRAWGHHLRMLGRLRPGLDREAGARELAVIANTPLPELPRVPWADLSQGLVLSSLRDEVTQGVRPALLAVIAAVVLLLAITGVNVTSLLLARGAQRQGEFAMRTALGAGRARLVRQLLTESLLLAVVGGVLGLAVAEVGVRALVALSPAGLPRLDAIRMDKGVLAFACALSAAVGIVVGVMPALQASNPALRAGVERTSRRTAGDFRRTRGLLVVAEVALALVLLVSAGLLFRSLTRLLAVETGFDDAPLLTMQVQVTGHRYDVDSLRYGFLQRSLEAVRALPGVTAAAYTSQLPLSDDLDIYGVHLERESDPANDGAALRYAVTPGYFATMGIPLRAGRLLEDPRRPGEPPRRRGESGVRPSAIPGGEPIGQRLRFGEPEGDWYTIVGVVGDVRQTALGLTTANAVYVTPTQWHWVDQRMSLVVRGRGTPATLAPAVRAGDLVGGQGPAGRPGRHDARAGPGLGGGPALRLGRVRGVRGRGTGAGRDRALRHSVGQCDRAHAGDRGALGAGRDIARHPRAGAAPGHGAHRRGRRPRADAGLGGEPPARGAPLRADAARPAHLRQRGRAPARRRGPRLLGAGLAGGAAGSRAHVAGGVEQGGGPGHRAG